MRVPPTTGDATTIHSDGLSVADADAGDREADVGPDTEAGTELPVYAEAVLDLVDEVPPGQATTYGDLAELIGSGGPRRPAAVMSRYGSMTTWWRVVRSDGSLPEELTARALAHWRAEGMPTRETGRGVVIDLRRARWAGPAPEKRPDEQPGEGLSVPGAGI